MVGRRNSAVSMLTLGAALLAGVASAAKTPPDDFTGHWVGTGQEKGKAVEGITADLTSQAGTRRFDGMVAIADDPPLSCTVTGKEKKKMKVKIKLVCGGSILHLHGAFDPTTETIAGGYVRVGQHKRHVGTFTLTKQAS